MKGENLIEFAARMERKAYDPATDAAYRERLLEQARIAFEDALRIEASELTLERSPS